MKNQIKQAPDYTIDEDGIVYNSKGKEMTNETGVVRLTVDGLVRRFKVSDLKIVLNSSTAKVPEAEIPEVKKEKTPKGEGVIATIQSSITQIPISQEEILNILVNKFPLKAKDSMKKTVHVQIGGKQPTRMEREKGISFQIEVKQNIKFYSL